MTTLSGKTKRYINTCVQGYAERQFEQQKELVSNSTELSNILFNWKVSQEEQRLFAQFDPVIRARWIPVRYAHVCVGLYSIQCPVPYWPPNLGYIATNDMLEPVLYAMLRPFVEPLEKFAQDRQYVADWTEKATEACRSAEQLLGIWPGARHYFPDALKHKNINPNRKFIGPVMNDATTAAFARLRLFKESTSV